MASNLNDCAFCDRKRANGVTMQLEDRSIGVYKFECPQCGKYGLLEPSTIARLLENNPDLKPSLSCAARQAFEAGQPLEITHANAAQLAAPHTGTRTSDNQEALLRAIAKRAGRPNSAAGISFADDYTLIDCHNSNEFAGYVQWIEKLGLASRSPGKNGAINLTLSMEGWERIQPAPRPGGVPGRCFVAMSFDPTLNDLFELGIAPAVTDCGLPKPLRIDQKEHNNQITDEMMAEIRDAEFVVADFTGNRAGVYYEAGFARGLGRPVIYCCRDSDFDARHFDTEQIGHIKWSDAADLRVKLANRIKATIIPKG